MLTGLSALELGRLRVSVGYGTHKIGRPLTPVEVAQLIERARRAGNSLSDCAREIRIDETGLSRFLRLLELPEDIRHLVDWGGGNGVLGFSQSVELLKIRSSDQLRTIARAVLEHDLTSKETRQVAQLLKRSGRPPEDVVNEVMGMRPIIERKYVFIGSVSEQALSAALANCTQREKDTLLRRALATLDLLGATGRLGTKRFTLVGDEEFGSSMAKIGKDKLEKLLCSEIHKGLDNASIKR